MVCAGQDHLGAGLGDQRGEHLDRTTLPDDQTRPTFTQVVIERRERGEQKRAAAGRVAVRRSVKQVRVCDEHGDHAPVRQRGVQGGVVVHTHVTADPPDRG